MAFFARISDPAVGGTYMTLLNTLTNLGGNWPATLALWIVDAITVKECAGYDAAKVNGTDGVGACDGKSETAACEAAGGTCVTLTEGYYIESAACVAFGLVWLVWGWPTIKRLQAAPVDDWRVVTPAAKKGEKAKA